MLKKKPKSTFEEFQKMVEWTMSGMDKEPQTTAEMMSQSFGAVGKSIVLMGWVYGKTLGFTFRLIKGGIRMVLRRKKKDKPADDPSFMSPEIAQKLVQQQGAIPEKFPSSPAQQPIESPAQQPVEPPAQQPVESPASPAQDLPKP